MIAADPDRLCPRPQLVRSEWFDLDGAWGFAFDDDDRGLADHWFTATEPFDRTITVPYPPESQLSGVHATEPHTVVPDHRVRF
ncbi:glycoside hydrolase family 2, partial [Amycolatopsis sp. 3B14]